jgi:hypothetical protein
MLHGEQAQPTTWNLLVSPLENYRLSCDSWSIGTWTNCRIAESL